ncbi:conserved hypothetical protein [Candidatus Sulfopaludibacter sp. SbA4]|nr:conserved hypothetical protein [Candidatus Sulfopaludibacter sp. SbA4]
MHQTQEIEKLRKLAAGFRSAILLTDPAEVDAEVRFIVADFPRNVCGAVCFLLGHYLIENGFPTSEYVNGMRAADRRSHAWIETEGVVVDITADQFLEIADGVVVSTDKSWYDQFSDKRGRRPADFLIYGESSPHGLAYGPILKNLRPEGA